MSQTSVVRKICEIMIKEKWLRYLEENRVVSNGQFEFRQGKACVMNLLSFCTRIIEGVENRDEWVNAA